MMGSLTKFTMKASTLKRMLSWYPPYIGAGVRVVELREDFRYAKIEMPLTWYNRNYVGTHFGGSLFSMCDPWYMLLLLNLLGKDYIVWDKAGSIEFVKPGKSKVTAEFWLSEELVESIYAMEPNEKKLVDLSVEVKDEEGGVVARLEKTEYIKRKALKESSWLDGPGLPEKQR